MHRFRIGDASLALCCCLFVCREFALFTSLEDKWLVSKAEGLRKHDDDDCYLVPCTIDAELCIGKCLILKEHREDDLVRHLVEVARYAEQYHRQRVVEHTTQELPVEASAATRLLHNRDQDQ